MISKWWSFHHLLVPMLARSTMLLMLVLMLLLLVGVVQSVRNVGSEVSRNSGVTWQQLQSVFPAYNACNDVSNSNKQAKQVNLPAFVVSNKNYSSVHRFFDSSPFSPSGRYIALTRFPVMQQHETSSQNKYPVDVVVIDLQSGKEQVIDSTYAWGSQVGAHVQWGGADTELFYNIIFDSKDGSHSGIRGVRYNMFTGDRSVLDCPVYHVSSSGKFAVAPNLNRIQYTQQGYGVDQGQNSSNANTNAPGDDGLFITNTQTGQCRLLASLKQFCEVAGLDTKSTPTYGFHAKWSSNDEGILFVVRTLDLPKSSSPLDRVWSTISALGTGKQKRVRTQHLFTLKADGSNIRHVVSWSSKPSNVFEKFTQTKTKDGSAAEPCFINNQGLSTTSSSHDINNNPSSVVQLLDGNHPNWLPHAYAVSMNLQNPNQLNTVSSSEHNPIRWSIAVFDLNRYNVNASKDPRRDYHYHRHSVGKTECSNGITRHLYPSTVLGSGHPNFAPPAHSSSAAGLIGRYFVADAYSKEKHLFASNQPANGCVPIRLVDSLTGICTWLLQVQVDRTVNLRKPKQDAHVERGSWRCDPHPAWSKDYQWLALNAYVPSKDKTAQRQVVVVYVGDFLKSNISLRI
jgi:hypothetical protein